MKVYEKINQLIGTDATQDEIIDFLYLNYICPTEVKEELEINNYPKELESIANKLCNGKCTEMCLVKFLDSEI